MNTKSAATRILSAHDQRSWRRALSVAIMTLLLCLPNGRADDPVPEDECLIEVIAPPGSRVNLAGRNYGTKLNVAYRPPVAGRLLRTTLRVTLPNGRTTEKELLLRGGWRVRVPISAGATAPEIVLQTGHKKAIKRVRLSADGRRILTGSDDKTAILWDAESGIQLRSFSEHEFLYDVAISSDGRRVLTAGDAVAIVWDADTGRKLRTLKGHRAFVNRVEISPDGRRVVTASGDHTAILWDTVSGRQLQTFSGHDSAIHHISISSNNRRVLTAGYITDRRHGAILWDAETGQKLREFSKDDDNVGAASITPDGRFVLTGFLSGQAVLWDIETSRRVRTFERKTAYFGDAVMSPNGRQLLTINPDGVPVLRDAEKGRAERILNGHKWGVIRATFSANGRQILTGSSDKTAILWDAESGRQIHRYGATPNDVQSIGLSGDDRHIITGSADGSARVWNGDSGEGERVLHGHSRFLSSVTLNDDGRLALTASLSDTDAILWDTRSGQQRRTFPKHQHGIVSAQISGDGQRILTSSGRTAILFDTATGRKIHTFSGHSRNVVTVAMTKDARRVLTGAADKSAILWDGRTGSKRATLPAYRSDFIEPHTVSYLRREMVATISSDGHKILTGSHGDRSAVVWNGVSGNRRHEFTDHRWAVCSVSLSADGRYALTGSRDRRVILRDTESQQTLRSFVSDIYPTRNALVSSDARFVVINSDEGTTRIYDTATGDELCRLISWASGDWLVVTPQGLFDGSENAMTKVMYRIGAQLNIVPVSRFFQDFYHPGLFAKLLAGARPQPVVDIGGSLPPDIKLISPKQGGDVARSIVTVQVEVHDNGGGVRGPWLRHNGARKSGHPTVQRIDQDTTQYTFEIALLGDDQKNSVQIEASTSDGVWESEPVKLSFTSSESIAKPDLYIVAVGVDDYAEDSFDLAYAAKDVTAMADLFRKRGPAFYEEVHVARLLNRDARKSAIRSAIREFAEQAGEQDTLLVHFSGHGFAVGQRYYFIPSEFQIDAGERPEDAIEDKGLAGDQIFRAIGATNALKRIVILDTCHSGAALDKTGSTPRNALAFAGMIRRLSRSRGVAVIAASTASAETAEVHELGHGVLTWSLLEGLNAVGVPSDRNADGNNNGVVNVLEWFSFAADRVPELTGKYLGVEQDVRLNAGEAHFPVLPVDNTSK